ncbi:hypothetical protein [Chishuiella changwenlii]|uniref:hypothetical protein n=1 Tax=Chishuiella changwenlii TaxID=1434701 RepID=UPI002FDAE6EE
MKVVENKEKWSPLEILKRTYDYPIIKDCEKNDVLNQIESFVCADATLRGVKDENMPQGELLDDISEMIRLRFWKLSLEEIELALKLNRYGIYEEKSEHYQFINAELISEILNKYCKWKFKKANEHNLSRTPERQIEVKPDLEKIEKEFLETILREIKANKKYRYIDCHLLLKDVPNRFKPTKKQYELLFEQESNFLKLQNNKKLEDKSDRLKLKKLIQNQNSSFEVLVKQRVYNIIVCNWLYNTKIKQ